MCVGVKCTNRELSCFVATIAQNDDSREQLKTNANSRHNNADDRGLHAKHSRSCLLALIVVVDNNREAPKVVADEKAGTQYLQ